MDSTPITAEEFLEAAREFVKISNYLADGWKLVENLQDVSKAFIRKDTFISLDQNINKIVKAEYVIFYNLSYGVPAFSFNIWNSSGVFLTLEDIRHLAFVKINQKDFYSVITQQEHPIFCRPYFVMHPCQTETLLASFKEHSKNIIVTFLSLICPLIKLNLPLEYGL